MRIFTHFYDDADERPMAKFNGDTAANQSLLLVVLARILRGQLVVIGLIKRCRDGNCNYFICSIHGISCVLCAWRICGSRVFRLDFSGIISQLLWPGQGNCNSCLLKLYVLVPCAVLIFAQTTVRSGCNNLAFLIAVLALWWRVAAKQSLR